MNAKNQVNIIGCKVLSYDGVSTRLNSNGLYLSPVDRSDISSQAKAEFNFYCFNDNILISAIKSLKKINIKYLFEGDFLGEFNQYSGYLRAAEGSYTRPIESLKLEIILSDNEFEFSLKGTVGDLIPFTYPANQTHEQEYSYEINFSVSGAEFNKIIEKGKLASVIDQM
jgi:hypothetical protein